MSTVFERSAPGSQPPSGEPDPFRYGWRYVRIVRPDGTEDLDQVPLTLEDVLHPEVGDVIVESDPHDSDSVYLRACLEGAAGGRPDGGGALGLPGGLQYPGCQAALPGPRRVLRRAAADRVVELQRGQGRGDGRSWWSR